MTEHSADLIENLVRRRKSNGRCVYDKAAKRELVRRCLQPGVSLARTAMEHGVNANLVRKWVKKQTGTQPSGRGRSIVSVVTPAPLLAVKSTQGLPAPGRSEGYLELIVAGGIIRVHGRIEVPTLSVALECLARHA